MLLSEKISFCRRRQALSQEALAARLNVSRQAVSKWETGDAEPENGNLLALAQIFGVTVDWLLNPDAPVSEQPEAETLPLPNLPAASAALDDPALAAPDDPAPAAPPHKGKSLEIGYPVYLVCIAAFFVFLAGFDPLLSGMFEFHRLLSFFDLTLLCSMLAGSILMLWASRLLRPFGHAVCNMFLPAEAAAAPAEACAQDRRAVCAALCGWGLGGLLCVLSFAINFLHSISLDAVSYIGTAACLFLNFLIYLVLGLFVLLPAAFAAHPE